MNRTKRSLRVLLLTTPRSYRLEAFREAADRLGVDVVTGMDLPRELAGQWPGVLAIDFRDPVKAVRDIVAYGLEEPPAAILAVDDSGSLIAAKASGILGLSHNHPDAAAAARDKYLMRRMLRDGGLPTPWFQIGSTQEDPKEIAGRVSYPCVLKPINLNGSRGVMRANNPGELEAAIARLSRMLVSAGPGESRSFLVEGYIPGIEVAMEGLLDRGELHVLAIFDKPDPLEGPFFEETIYVTPSRLPMNLQKTILKTASDAALALGLSEGPVHAELRVNEDGVWPIELAGRSIGGLCSEVLRFGVDGSLEDLILRQACRMDFRDRLQSLQASGVMMIPIPRAGILRGVSGIEEAAAVPLVVGVKITSPLNYPLVPLPEGDSYLGFIFSRGESADAVELALRQAHRCLNFEIDSLLAFMPA